MAAKPPHYSSRRLRATDRGHTIGEMVGILDRSVDVDLSLRDL